MSTDSLKHLDWDANVFRLIQKASRSLVQSGARREACAGEISQLKLHLSRLPTSGFASGDIEIVNDGAEIEKTLIRPSDTEITLWLNEVRFYLEFRDLLSCEELYIPKLKGMQVDNRAKVRITLEYIKDINIIRRLEDKVRVAQAFGRLSAYASQLGCHRKNWLRRRRELEDSDFSSFKNANGLLLALGTEKEMEVFRDFFAERTAIRALRDRGIPTLCHGDASHSNILRRSSPSDGFVALDWARVRAGMIGDDLFRLIHPWLTMRSDVATQEEDAEIENLILGHYIEAVAAVLPAAEHEQIITCYQIRSVTLGIIIASAYSSWLRATKQDSIRQIRMHRIRCLYRLLADRAAHILKVARS